MQRRHWLAALGISLIATPLAAEPDSRQQEMVDLAWKRGCFNCHDLDTTLRGPAWRDVGERYQDDSEALERLIPIVRNGGGGNWGDEFMTANRRVPEEDIRQLVEWILTLRSTESSVQN